MTFHGLVTTISQFSIWNEQNSCRNCSPSEVCGQYWLDKWATLPSRDSGYLFLNLVKVSLEKAAFKAKRSVHEVVSCSLITILLQVASGWPRPNTRICQVDIWPHISFWLVVRVIPFRNYISVIDAASQWELISKLDLNMQSLCSVSLDNSIFE